MPSAWALPTGPSWRHSVISPPGCTPSAPRRGSLRPASLTGSLILICGHAGLATGEDGPTHADPQALQLLQENFPPGAAVTLTPWEPQEIWPLAGDRLSQRPALIAPFVTRPEVKVLDRVALGLAAPEEATTGVYLLRRPRGTGDVTIVLQESAVTYAFVTETLPLLDNDGIDPRVYYVASAELFDALPLERRHELFPEAHALDAIGVTGFTLPTLYRWVRSDAGREATLHPFRRGHYLGSGKGMSCSAEAGLDGASQFTAIKKYLDGKVRSGGSSLLIGPVRLIVREVLQNPSRQ